MAEPTLTTHSRTHLEKYSRKTKARRKEDSGTSDRWATVKLANLSLYLTNSNKISFMTNKFYE
jgi:hypothetical protein